MADTVEMLHDDCRPEFVGVYMEQSLHWVVEPDDYRRNDAGPGVGWMSMGPVGVDRRGRRWRLSQQTDRYGTPQRLLGVAGSVPDRWILIPTAFGELVKSP